MVFFISTSGIAIDFHFCKGEMKRYKLFGIAKSCHEIIENQNNSDSTVEICKHKTKLESKACCSNKSLFSKYNLEGFELEFQDLSFELKRDFSLTILQTASLLNINGKFRCISEYLNYKPPLLEKDLHKLFQQFLC